MKIPIFGLVLLLVVIEVYGLKNYIDLSTNGVDSFDVSEKWPQCKDVFEDIQSQGNCSSSWAISVATSIRDRRCIKSGLKEPISAYDLISCCHDCQLDGKNGCNGGDHNSAFRYFLNEGIVTGGSYQSQQGCKPYPILPDPKVKAPRNTECIRKCDFSYKQNNYNDDKIKGKDQLVFSHNNENVMNEIMENGPVIAEFKKYEDFYNYSGGIYQHKEGKLLGYYYAKILGWGITEKGQSFWRAAASFGNNWGENGTFRIQRGSDESGFESNIIAGIVDPAELGCQKITAYYNGTLKNKYVISTPMDVQIQVNAEINLKEERIYFKFDHWNKTLANGYWFDIYNDSSAANCNTTQKEPCYVPFYTLNRLLMAFMPYTGEDAPFLIWLDPLINKRFTLVDVFGNCARSLKNNDPDTDPLLYRGCFCCGDKYNPDPLLNCPVSPWS